eukprot:GHVS01022773.1.p1 GENE.GHVS01022773.1~~GHVS01022773.1.p1  ORF type:complete len:490 (-),score=147.09 GHVS01022773.1:155-1624(-)
MSVITAPPVGRLLSSVSVSSSTSFISNTQQQVSPPLHNKAVNNMWVLCVLFYITLSFSPALQNMLCIGLMVMVATPCYAFVMLLLSQYYGDGVQVVAAIAKERTEESSGEEAKDFDSIANAIVVKENITIVGEQAQQCDNKSVVVVVQTTDGEEEEEQHTLGDVQEEEGVAVNNGEIEQKEIDMIGDNRVGESIAVEIIEKGGEYNNAGGLEFVEEEMREIKTLVMVSDDFDQQQDMVEKLVEVEEEEYSVVVSLQDGGEIEGEGDNREGISGYKIMAEQNVAEGEDDLFVGDYLFVILLHKDDDGESSVMDGETEICLLKNEQVSERENMNDVVITGYENNKQPVVGSRHMDDEADEVVADEVPALEMPITVCTFLGLEVTCLEEEVTCLEEEEVTCLEEEDEVERGLVLFEMDDCKKIEIAVEEKNKLNRKKRRASFWKLWTYGANSFLSFAHFSSLCKTHNYPTGWRRKGYCSCFFSLPCDIVLYR